MTPVWHVEPYPESIHREGPGQFREHDIHPFGKGMQPLAWPLLGPNVQSWVDEVNTSEPTLRSRGSEHPLPEALARMHNEFERIHPFLDGNGRAGRLLLNLILVRIGYPPVIVLKQQRPLYLAAMQKADDGDVGPLGDLLARAMYDNLNRFIVRNLAEADRLVPLPALTTEELSLAALRQAARRGRLDAVQGADGVWRSTRHAVGAYRSGRRRGRSAGG